MATTIHVSLPWLPPDTHTRVLLLAGALVQEALGDGQHGPHRLYGPILSNDALRHKLHRLLETLLILVPPSGLGVTLTPEIAGSHARHYLRNLTGVIPQWETIFVPTVTMSDMVFNVTLGCDAAEPIGPLMDSPFQLPRERVLFRVVPRGVSSGLTFTPDGRSWAARVLPTEGDQS